jgi:signal transduction histidine kinase
MNEVEILREQLKQAQIAYQMAMTINQFKTGFLGRIAHELRSPLASLMSVHQLILSDLCENPEEERQFIGQAYHSAQKMMKIIDEIIAVSKIEYGTTPLNISCVQLGNILSDLAEITHLLAANRHLQLTIIPPKPEVLVLVDREHFLQAIVTLVDTAIAHLEGGYIRVTADIFNDLNYVELIVEFPGELSLWQDPKSDLLEQIPDCKNLEAVKIFGQQTGISPATKLLLVNSVLEQMGCRIDIATTTLLTIQIKISIPLRRPQPLK